MKTELRFAGELRAAGTARIGGYAAVFDQPTQIGSFTEVIRKGAFTRALKEKQDVRLLLNHDANNILARTKSGTLSLSEDSHGLAFLADLPDTQLGRDVLTLIKRQDLNQCSFAFVTKKENWADGDLREILDVDLYDASVVAYPAYEGTSVGARQKELVAAVGAELRRSGRNHFSTIGFYRGTPRREREQSCSSVSVSELERLRLRFRFLKMQP